MMDEKIFAWIILMLLSLDDRDQNASHRHANKKGCLLSEAYFITLLRMVIKPNMH